ncbi:hypothetical protein [Vagococcus salmoninarum]|uniref:hypothetical protein n=1 Tax=Vagococcus salmoninarum TaxID=2739 RepID=UPI003F9B4E2D
MEAGISFGCALAMIISFTTWKSIPWAILHGMFSWLYVIYFAMTYPYSERYLFKPTLTARIFIILKNHN